jgi:Tol biopolymer transport system component
LPPFPAATVVPALLSGANDDDPTLTADLLELYFNSDRGGVGDIWMSSRSSTSADWGAPVVVTELQSDADDSAPEVSPDGLTLWWVSERGGADRDVWSSTRAARDQPWSTPSLVA